MYFLLLTSFIYLNIAPVLHYILDYVIDIHGKSIKVSQTISLDHLSFLNTILQRFMIKIILYAKLSTLII